MIAIHSTDRRLCAVERAVPAGRRGMAVAFTLVELLLVLVLLAVLTGGMALSFGGRHHRYVVESTAQDLAAACRLAATEAKLRQTTCCLVFQGDPIAYRVEVADPQAKDGFTPIGGLGGRANTVSKGVDIAVFRSDGTAIRPLPESLRFNPQGEQFCGVIQLTHGQAETVRVEVSGAGQVHVRPR